MKRLIADEQLTLFDVQFNSLKDEIIKQLKNNFDEIDGNNNKESGDNLGEEILAICLHILSHVPGMKDGKLCVITEDKGGAGKINSLMQATNRYYKGARIIIYSTPKLIQTMIYSNIKINKEDLSSFLRADDGSNIVITGTTEYDFHSCRNISLTKSELVELLMESGKINILF